jgi:hypothetical protein
MIKYLILFLGLLGCGCATFGGPNPSLITARNMRYWNLRMYHNFPKTDNPGFRLFLNFGAPTKPDIADPYDPDTLNFVRLLEIDGKALYLFEIKTDNNFKIGLNISDRCNYDKTMHKVRYLGYTFAIPSEFLDMIYQADTMSCIFTTFEHEYEWKWSEDELKKFKSFFESYILTDSIASGIIKR